MADQIGYYKYYLTSPSFDMRESLLNKKDFDTMYSKLKEFNSKKNKEAKMEEIKEYEYAHQTILGDEEIKFEYAKIKEFNNMQPPENNVYHNISEETVNLEKEFQRKIYGIKEKSLILPTIEKVLVFPKSVLKDWEKNFFGFRKEDPPSTISSCAFLQSPTLLSSLSYMDRDLVEKNENFLQLIPYCVFKCGKNFLVYQRTKKGGESRLHDKWSLGVGGHINDSDGETHASYENGMLRELAEEVSFEIPSYYEQSYFNVDNAPIQTNHILGFIYDDSNEVGRVHFGVVHLIEVNNDIILNFKDEALDKGNWVGYDWLVENSEKFENWSQLIIEHLG